MTGRAEPAEDDALALTCEEVASSLCLDLAVVDHLIGQGHLAAVGLGDQRRVRASDLLALLNAHRQSPHLAVLARTFLDAKFWAREVLRRADLARAIEDAHFAEDSMGAFLRDGFESVRRDEREPDGAFKVLSPSVFALDPAVRALTPERLAADVAAYEQILERRGSEEELHEFLATHSYFFNGILRLFAPSPLFSKIKLGSQYVTDFAWFDSASSGPEWRFAEIEGPRHSMFTRAGEPSARLHHAIQQVRDWHAWVHQHLEYARRLMLHVEYPLGYVFIGRRSEITDRTRDRFRRLAYEHRAHVHIHTLDWFATAARSVETLLRGRGGGWPVPMAAFSHADLEAHRPIDSFAWLSQAGSRSDIEDRLSEREGIWHASRDLPP